MSGVFRWVSGYPYEPYVSDSNQIGDLTHNVRPDVVAGVPIVNPYFSYSCPTGTSCEPYVNPSAFMRPPLGQLGDAPRTLDGARGPWARYFDAAVMKTFRLGESGKRRLQIRCDGLNVFNHPVFAVYPNSGGGADFMGAPSTSTLSTSAYNTWAAANSQPLQSTTAGAAIYNGIVNMVNAQKTPQGALPANFYTVPLPANFWAMTANSFDITTLQGYKLYQLRTTFGASNFGTLYNSGFGSPRFVQFGAKFFF